ncbi:hypothetical protein [Acidovorax sp. LjRoot117]|uniref:hypothetical protein n=1 Tax=Acidovorax sp. LjRoot117 TaxID=3342255 RepID=UPI003ECC9AA4
MNKSLARIHLGLAIFYGLLAALLSAIHLTGDKASATGVLIFAAVFGTPLVLHALALRGVRNGLLWGRSLSRTLGILLLFAVPIGTVLGAFVIMRTGPKDWENSASG